MALADRDGGWYLQEAVENAGRRLRDTGRCSIGKCLGAARRDSAAALRDLAGSGDDSQGNRGSEVFEVVIIDLILKAFLSDLIEAVELVEIDGVTVRHNQTVEGDGHASLLAEARRSNFLRFAEHHGSFGDNDVLAVMRIQGIGNKDLDRSNSVSVKSIHKHRIEHRTFVNEIGLACGGIDIGFEWTFIAGRRFF